MQEIPAYCMRWLQGCCRNAAVRNFPLLSEQGWTRPQQNIAKPPLWSGRGGDPIPPNLLIVFERGLKGMLLRRCVARIFPSSLRRGGCAIQKTSRSIQSSRRRGGVQPQQNSVELDHHPVRSIKEASRYFVEVASTPPRRGGENREPVLLGKRRIAAENQKTA